MDPILDPIAELVHLTPARLAVALRTAADLLAVQGCPEVTHGMCQYPDLDCPGYRAGRVHPQSVKCWERYLLSVARPQGPSRYEFCGDAGGCPVCGRDHG